MRHKDKQLGFKKARRKYLTNGLVNMLRKIMDSPLRKAYINTFFCSETLADNGEEKLTASYCKNRWCLTCQSIRIANLINGYKPELDKLKDAYFVTLTAKTVKKDDLTERLSEMQDNWNKIRKNSIKRSVEFNGVRKLECTARPNDKYHPHYHLIIDGKESAEWVVDQWLRLWRHKVTPSGQDVRKANEGSYLELFKYFTKLITKSHEKDMFRQDGRKLMHPEKLDWIFQCMKGRRVFAAFGNVKKVDEDNTNETAMLKSPYPGSVFKWVDSDWFDTKTGEGLTGFIPIDEMTEMLKPENIKEKKEIRT